MECGEGWMNGATLKMSFVSIFLIMGVWSFGSCSCNLLA